MGAIAISVENVSKKYRLYNSKMERIKETLHPLRKKYHHEFWALRDIDFKIETGSTVGVVGRNGSGKSSLLQIICSILQPTTGAVEVVGKIAALLELGVGFNPDFTGRENVLLNGALMGIPVSEMQKRLSMVEAFADIGEYFEQPVRFYSSGMFVRLAFSSAIHVDPNILIVDEALAVGDAKFQHKCFQKIYDLKKGGKTILFVTHDMNTILNICDYALLLDEGRLLANGRPKDVVHQYIDIIEGRKTSKRFVGSAVSPRCPENVSEVVSREVGQEEFAVFLKTSSDADKCSTRRSYNKNEYRQGFARAEIIDYFIVCGEVYDPAIIFSGSRIDLFIKVRFHEPVFFPLFGFAIKSVDGVLICGFNTSFIKESIPPAQESEIIIYKFSIKMDLAPGEIYFDLGTDEKNNPASHESLDRRCSIVHLTVQSRIRFEGLVGLETSSAEFARNGVQVGSVGT